MITMAEIARLTGVSQPTVSRVLNGNKAVNPEIRERVLACAREHEFQPNVMAQSLVGSKTHLIGVVVTDIGNAFFADLVKHIEQAAGQAGYSMILFNSGYDRNHEKECLDVVRRYRVDGLIVVPVEAESAQWKEQVAKLEIPAVVITRKASGMDSFYVDHAEAGAQAARHLCEQEYEEFLFLGNTADEKYIGFEQILKELRKGVSTHLTVITAKDTEQVRDALERHFSKHQGPTGIFAYNDRRAVQVLGLLEQMRIRIPEEAGVVGFDNIYMCEYLYPKLSSIAQPNQKMAELAVTRLLERLEHPEETKKLDHPLHAELICRESSDRVGRKENEK